MLLTTKKVVAVCGELQQSFCFIFRTHPAGDVTTAAADAGAPALAISPLDSQAVMWQMPSTAAVSVMCSLCACELCTMVPWLSWLRLVKIGIKAE